MCMYTVVSKLILNQNELKKFSEKIYENITTKMNNKKKKLYNFARITFMDGNYLQIKLLF